MADCPGPVDGECPVPRWEVADAGMCKLCDRELFDWHQEGRSAYSIRVDPDAAYWWSDDDWGRVPAGVDELTPRATGIERGMGAVDGFDADHIRHEPPPVGPPLKEER